MSVLSDHMSRKSLTSSPAPLYHQVLTILKQRLTDGVYRQGDRLPTEDALTEEFGVSRATVRQAVGELVRAGAVVRRQGLGTFASDVPIRAPVMRLRGSVADMLKDTGRSRIFNTANVKHKQRLPLRASELLSVDPPIGTIIVRTRKIEGSVFAYTVNYLPPKYGELLSEPELRSEALMRILARRGVKIVNAVQSIHAQVADTDVSSHLGVGFGAAVLFAERILYGPRKEPIELVQTWYRGDTYEYTVNFDLKGRTTEDFARQLA